MPAPRKDQKARDMYDLYTQGFSLAQVATAFGVTRQGVHKMFTKRNYAMRTIKPLPFFFGTVRSIRNVRMATTHGRVVGESFCTETYGSPFMARFPRAFIFTILTGIAKIIISTILSCSLHRTTVNCMPFPMRG